MVNPYKLNPQKNTFFGENNYATDNDVILSQFNFSKGINYSVLSTAIDFESEMIESSNFMVAIDGMLRTRPGTDEILDTGVESAIQGLGEYKGSVVYAQAGKVYVAEVEVGTCAAVGNVNFLNYHGYLVILDGNTLKSYDGTTYQEVANAPKVKYGMIKHDRLWVGGDLTEPYRLWVCGPNDIEDWGSAGLSLGGSFDFDAFDVDSYDRNYVSGVGLFYDSTIVFKSGQLPRIFRIDGNSMLAVSDNPYTQSTIMDGESCINDRTIAVTPAGTLFLGNDGVYIIDGSKQVITLVSHYINIRLMDTAYFDYTTACSLYWAKYGLYVLASGTTMWVFNVLTRGWFKWTVPFSVTSMKLIDGYLYLGTAGGTLHKMDGVYTDDDGEDIVSELYTGYYDFGDISRAKVVREMYLALAMNGEGYVEVEFRPNFAPIYGASLQIWYNADDEAIHTGGGIGGISAAVNKLIKIGTEATGGFDEAAFGWDTTMTYGWDGRADMPYLHKLPVSIRCTNLGIYIKATYPVTIQNIEFLASIVRPAP